MGFAYSILGNQVSDAFTANVVVKGLTYSVLTSCAGLAASAAGRIKKDFFTPRQQPNMQAVSHPTLIKARSAMASFRSARNIDVTDVEAVPVNSTPRLQIS